LLQESHALMLRREIEKDRARKLQFNPKARLSNLRVLCDQGAAACATGD
jgi:hypothetical protein